MPEREEPPNASDSLPDSKLELFCQPDNNLCDHTLAKDLPEREEPPTAPDSLLDSNRELFCQPDNTNSNTAAPDGLLSLHTSRDQPTEDSGRFSALKNAHYVVSGYCQTTQETLSEREEPPAATDSLPDSNRELFCQPDNDHTLAKDLPEDWKHPTASLPT